MVVIGTEGFRKARLSTRFQKRTRFDYFLQQFLLIPALILIKVFRVVSMEKCLISGNASSVLL